MKNNNLPTNKKKTIKITEKTFYALGMAKSQLRLKTYDETIYNLLVKYGVLE